MPKNKYFFLDTSEIADKESFLRAIAEAMSFPDYFGHNWDALNECLNDLSWIDGDRKVLIWADPLNLLQSLSPEDSKSLSQILRDAPIDIHNVI